MSVETAEDDGETAEDDEEGVPNSVLVTSAVCAFVTGVLSGYMLVNLGTLAVAVGFLVGATVSGYYLSQKTYPSEVVGSASYVAGGLLVIAPSVLYLSNVAVGGHEVLLFPEGVELAEVGSVSEMLFGADGPDLNSALRGDITAIMPLVAWTFVYMLVALVLFVVGVFLRNRGERQRRWKAQRERD
ncbi:MAG: hypothetical protein U5J64_05400 [Halobacteriales archaeon]|nr:hypothetical protein [Halobacteriales archaeon]